jgi:glycosyltransferase involved in cell wall biosynthesis
MKIIHILMATAHGHLSPSDILAGNRGVTGSEQAMLFLARQSARRGHRVVVYLPTKTEVIDEGVCYLDYTTEYPRLREMDTADVVVSWLSADPLVRCRTDQLRVHSIQINDWLLNSAADPQYAHVDVFLCVSQAQSEWLWRAQDAPLLEPNRIEIVPNGVDCGRFTRVNRRRALRCVYSSSPDRGLHWLLHLWPEIRREFPDARLHVYYEMEKWIAGCQGLITEVGQRVRYTMRRLQALNGHGVIVEGAVSPLAVADALLQSDFFLYPCDPVAPTEGFSVSTMEACAAGCLPIITDADALGEIYKESGALIIPRGEGRGWVDTYLDTVLAAMKDSEDGTGWVAQRRQCRQFAERYDWSYVADQFHAMIERRIAMKGQGINVASHPALGR